MISYSHLRQKLLEQNDLVDVITVNGLRMSITKDLSVYANEKLIVEAAETLDEARRFALNYTELGEESSLVHDRLLIESIEKHHSVRVTDTLLETYRELIDSQRFVVDPVLKESKRFDEFGKLRFILNDGSPVSLDENTYDMLCNLLMYKYEIVEFMHESIDNFKRVIREIR